MEVPAWLSNLTQLQKLRVQKTCFHAQFKNLQTRVHQFVHIMRIQKENHV